MWSVDSSYNLTTPSDGFRRFRLGRADDSIRMDNSTYKKMHRVIMQILSEFEKLILSQPLKVLVLEAGEAPG